MLIREDKKKVAFFTIEVKMHSDDNHRPQAIFDDEVVMDKYPLKITVMHCPT